MWSGAGIWAEVRTGRAAGRISEAFCATQETSTGYHQRRGPTHRPRPVRTPSHIPPQSRFRSDIGTFSTGRLSLSLH
jgi:hypothetical protein